MFELSGAASNTTTKLDSAYAASPFDHPKADIILRSSDNVDFRVFKLFLSLASPFFETLFDLPQPDNTGNEEMKDGLVVIPVFDNSKTLDALFRFCYPCTLAEDPCLEELKDALDVLEAAKKYSLDAIERRVSQAICNPKILEFEPIRCFAIARRGQLEEEALSAAKYTLRHPLIPTWFEEIDLITSTDLLELLTYHRRCGDAVQELKRDMSWITNHYASSDACAWLAASRRSGYCACQKWSTTKYRVFDSSVLQWWNDFMEDTFFALQDKPCGATVDHMVELTVRKVRGSGCGVCSVEVANGMREFSELFKRKVDELVSKVDLRGCIQRDRQSEQTESWQVPQWQAPQAPQGKGKKAVRRFK